MAFLQILQIFHLQCKAFIEKCPHRQNNSTNHHLGTTLPFLRSDKAHGLAREVCTKQTRSLHVQLQLTADSAAGHFACGRGSTGGFSFLFCSVMKGFNVTTGSVISTTNIDDFFATYIPGLNVDHKGSIEMTKAIPYQFLFSEVFSETIFLFITTPPLSMECYCI